MVCDTELALYLTGKMLDQKENYMPTYQVKDVWDSAPKVRTITCQVKIIILAQKNNCLGKIVNELLILK